MKRTLGLAVVLALLFSGAPAPSEAGPPPLPQVTCTFTNPAYSGKCVQTAEVAQGSTAKQACESILQCLNNVDCIKTYCNATSIRGGWKLESAK